MRWVAVGLLFAIPHWPAHAQSADEIITRARACIERSGVAACTAVLGMCDPVWGYDRRRACAGSLAESWDLVLHSYQADMLTAARTFDAANNRDNVPALQDALHDDQNAWLIYRRVHCASIWVVNILSPVPTRPSRSARPT